MEIVVAENAGYCFGVKRALDIVESVLRKNRGRDIYSLGEIIHNPQVIERLKNEGLIVVYDIEDVKDGSIVIISAHGRSEGDIIRLRERGCEIVDATCPHVIFPQRTIKELSSEGYFIILLGDREHPEVQGLVSFSNGKGIAVVNKDVEDFSFVNSQKVGLLAQTTQNREDFKNLIEKVALRFKEMRVFNTICEATRIRQEEAIRISRDVDIMVVIGGRNSANTKRLFELARKYCKRAIHIESESEILKEDFVGVNRVGVTAGASTPDYIIRQVVDKIRGL